MVYALEINKDNFAPAKLANIGQLTNLFLPLIVSAAGLVFFVMILMAVFNILKAGDNAETIKKSYATIVWSTIGLFVVISSFVVVKLIGKMLEINITSP